MPVYLPRNQTALWFQQLSSQRTLIFYHLPQKLHCRPRGPTIYHNVSLLTAMQHKRAQQCTTKYNNEAPQSTTMQGSKHTDTTGPITTGSLDGLALAHNGEWQKTATLIISPPAKMGLLLLTNPNFQIKIHNWTSKVRCLITAFFHCLVISAIQIMLLTSKCCFTF